MKKISKATKGSMARHQDFKPKVVKKKVKKKGKKK
jgi:hypothetical protein